MKAGVSSVCITPNRPIWMAGFGARDKRSEGKYQDLFVKALALQDKEGQRAVVVTADFIGYIRELSEPVLQQVKERYGLQPSQVLLNASHTHCGPVIGERDYYPEWDPEYAQGLVAKTVEAIGRALDNLEEARLWQGRGSCTLGVNRRRPLPDDPARVNLALLPNPQGPTDPDVPVLKVARPDGSVKAALFLYACHPTTMGGYLLGGDYPGFAQQFLEAEIKGANALFLQGCGGDVKTRNVGADGRFKSGPLEVVEGFGRELAQAVLTTLAGALTELDGDIAVRLGALDLPVQGLPPRAELEARAHSDDWRSQKARKVLETLDAGRELPRSHPHTAQVIAVGEALTLIGLSGEMCVDYALRLKRELGGGIWVSGYCHDVSAYIPSARMIPQGGYEVERWLAGSDLPAPFVPAIEDMIVGKVHEMARA
ncbi:MAG: hypothetical protein A3F84_29725 [Candidatus Handelsmanbacteria bacterium RIFCSPLOWO2_12_FULL_64_10]|uniref:Neutral/alkaline non-lysosomal ceramidase N-terminal domain-containing protein n=1 Tax=Handelsmanbacteria sp. (strain RIFCSPLOWO2_12_FULL_64_10) TaxID=1817868 RepID=A0A1F6D2D3_HANXR|nr:MAG: hypothetical protein A3F84_29725 [Candidatus Handelsmanbacteria bacterium RIFCSPLOWO2_12_FULL_64_10]